MYLIIFHGDNIDSSEASVHRSRTLWPLLFLSIREPFLRVPYTFESLADRRERLVPVFPWKNTPLGDPSHVGKR